MWKAILVLFFLLLHTAASADDDPVEDRIRQLPDKIIEAWRRRHSPYDVFDPEAQPPGVDPYATLRDAMEQYVDDIDSMRRGRPSRHQRNRDASPDPETFDRIVDRCMICVASREATRDYQELTESSRDELENSPESRDEFRRG